MESYVVCYDIDTAGSIIRAAVYYYITKDSMPATSPRCEVIHLSVHTLLHDFEKFFENIIFPQFDFIPKRKIKIFLQFLSLFKVFYFFERQ